MIKMEVGKKYVCRDGTVRGPFVLNKEVGVFELEDVHAAGGRWPYWFPTGRYLAAKEDDWDCMEEWKDKEKWLKVGEYYDYKKNFPLPGPVARAKCIEVIGETAVMVVWRHANPNGMVELENFYTALVSVENTGGKYRPIVDAPAAFQEEQFEFPEANAEQPF